MRGSSIEPVLYIAFQSRRQTIRNEMTCSLFEWDSTQMKFDANEMRRK